VVVNNMYYLKMSHLKSFRNITDYLITYPKNSSKYVVFSHSARIFTIKVIYVP